MSRLSLSLSLSLSCKTTKKRARDYFFRLKKHKKRLFPPPKRWKERSLVFFHFCCEHRPDSWHPDKKDTQIFKSKLNELHHTTTPRGRTSSNEKKKKKRKEALANRSSSLLNRIIPRETTTSGFFIVLHLITTRQKYFIETRRTHLIKREEWFLR